jgi:uncharacterized protein YodC (DUF2158 family)
MGRQFQDGDAVAHKTDKSHQMTVIGYTGDGKVICRWKDRNGFQREEFLEAELEVWQDSPRISFGRIEGADPDDYKW